MRPEPAVLDEFVRRILTVAKPLRIILFGSAARGDMHEGSDIDLLVVMPDGTGRLDCAQSLYGAARGTRIPCDFVVATESDVRRYEDSGWTPIHDAVRTGMELYCAGR